MFPRADLKRKIRFIFRVRHNTTWISILHTKVEEASNSHQLLLSDSSSMVAKFSGSVTVNKDVITLTEGSFEFRLSLTPEMILKYDDHTLEIRAAGWRCVLYEPKELTEREDKIQC